MKLENHFTTVLTMRRSSKNISHNSSTIFQPLGYVTIQCKFIIKERIIPVS